MVPEIYEPWTEDMQLLYVQVQHRESGEMVGKRYVFDDAEAATEMMDYLARNWNLGLYDICWWFE